MFFVPSIINKTEGFPLKLSVSTIPNITWFTIDPYSGTI